MLLFIECKPNVFRGHSKRFSVSFTAIFDGYLVARSINFHKQADV